MFRKGKILLSLICLSLIFGIMFNAIYIRNKHGKYVQYKKKELATDILVTIKTGTKTKISNEILSDGTQKFMVLKLGGSINNYPVKEIEVPGLNIMKIKKTGTVVFNTTVGHTSGIDYDSSKLENKFIKRGKRIKKMRMEAKIQFKYVQKNIKDAKV